MKSINKSLLIAAVFCSSAAFAASNARVVETKGKVEIEKDKDSKKDKDGSLVVRETGKLPSYGSIDPVFATGLKTKGVAVSELELGKLNTENSKKEAMSDVDVILKGDNNSAEAKTLASVAVQFNAILAERGPRAGDVPANEIVQNIQIYKTQGESELKSYVESAKRAVKILTADRNLTVEEAMIEGIVDVVADIRGTDKNDARAMTALRDFIKEQQKEGKCAI